MTSEPDTANSISDTFTEKQKQVRIVSDSLARALEKHMADAISGNSDMHIAWALENDL